MALRENQSSNVVNMAGVGTVSAQCDVSSLIARQMGQLLAGVPSLAGSSSPCIRNTEAFSLCPDYEGGCVFMSSIVTDSGRIVEIWAVQASSVA